MLCPSVATLAFYGKLSCHADRRLGFAHISHVCNAVPSTSKRTASPSPQRWGSPLWLFNVLLMEEGELTTIVSSCRNTFPIHRARLNVLAVEHRQTNRQQGCIHGVVEKSTDSLCVGIN